MVLQNGAVGDDKYAREAAMSSTKNATSAAQSIERDESELATGPGLKKCSEESITREQRRSRRKRDVRARTISVKRMTKRELEIGRLLFPEQDYWKPRTRAECVEGLRPCPFVSCKHHLFIDVSARTGAIKLNFPDLEAWEMTESCALDVADRGGTTLEDVGAIMNLTRERIRQVEVKALAKLEALSDMSALRDYVDEGPVGRRRLPKLVTPSAEQLEDEESDDFDSDEVTSGSAASDKSSCDGEPFDL